MLMTIPVLLIHGMPPVPAAVTAVPAAVLVLLAVLGAVLAALLRPDRPAPPAGGRGLAGYRAFLAARDGSADLTRHTLSHREARFAALEGAPLRSQASIDRDAYRRNLARRRIEPGLPPRLLWLLATAKSNQAERFGVGFAELYGRVPAVDDDPVRVHLHLQETYHTRVLADAVGLFGLAVHTGPPPFWVRALIESMVLLPPGWTLPMVGCSEMVGCVIFRALRDRGVALFAEEPAIAERLRSLYDEILADELSHVGFVAAQLGPRGRALMRRLFRWTGLRMVGQMPELRALFGRAELARRFRDFRLDAMAAEFPTTAYAAALV